MKLATISKLTEQEAREYLERLRWPSGAACIHCGSTDVIKLNNSSSKGRKCREGLYQCRDCRKQFTVTCGTIFENSRISIRTWLMTFAILCSSKKGVSAHQIHRMLGISYKSAWFVCHRVRWAMTQEPLKGMLTGTVEVDETYVGGSYRNRRSKFMKGPIYENKTPVVALVQRDGEVRTQVVANVTAKNLRDVVEKHLDKSATLMTDEHSGYIRPGREYAKHETVNHGKLEYVRGDAYTNTVESYFSLLKRGVNGSFHHVSPEHLQRYCNEFSFRWNSRKITDEERTEIALRATEGKRLTYKAPLNPLAKVA